MRSSGSSSSPSQRSRCCRSAASSTKLDWIVLVGFLITSVVAAQLLHREQEATRRAQADALKDALIASVSHDLRTPLTTIKALAHQLGELGDQSQQHAAELRARRPIRLRLFSAANERVEHGFLFDAE